MVTPSSTATATPSSPTGTVVATSVLVEGGTTTVAMTTPFSMPDDCVDFGGDEMPQIIFGSIVSLVSQASSCFPFGITKAVYNPAVCPSDWTYYSVVQISRGVDTTHAPSVTVGGTVEPGAVIQFQTYLTTAHCCPSGYWINLATYALGDDVSMCSMLVNPGDTTITATDTMGTTSVFTGPGTLRVSATTVSWRKSDVPTMLPKLPIISEEMFIQTWVPGDPAIFKSQFPEVGGGGSGLATGVFAVVIAVPILIFLAILGCCICCVRRRRRKEKREMAKETEESEPNADETAATTHDTQDVEGRPSGARATEETVRETQTTVTDTAAPLASASTAVEVHNTATHTATQRLAAPEQAPVAGSSTSPLSSITKPIYPGLPTHGFDGIEEPPPYVEAPPRYDTSRRLPSPAQVQPVSDAATSEEASPQPPETQNQTGNRSEQ